MSAADELLTSPTAAETVAIGNTTSTKVSATAGLDAADTVGPLLLGCDVETVAIGILMSTSTSSDAISVPSATKAESGWWIAEVAGDMTSSVVISVAGDAVVHSSVKWSPR